MYPSSALAFLLALSAATPALAQCSERQGSFLLSCVNNRCDTSELTSMAPRLCPNGQFASFRLERAECNRRGTCEYEYFCCQN